MSREDSLDTLGRTVDYALDVARAAGADKAAVAVSRTLTRRVQVYQRDIESIRETTRSVLVISALKGQRHGRTMVASLREPDIRAGVERACAIAAFADPDPWIDLPDPDSHPVDFPDLGIWQPEPRSIEALSEHLLAAADRGLDAADAGAQLSRFGIESSAAQSVLGTSRGFRGRERAAIHTAFTEWLERSESGAQKFFDSWSFRPPIASTSLDALLAHCRSRARSLLGARPIATARCRVLFSDAAASFLFHAVINALMGSLHVHRRSFLSGCLDLPILPEGINVVDEARLPGGLASSNFDNEGVATGRTVLFRDGRLASLLLASQSARRLGLRSTGHASGVYNVLLGGDHSETEQCQALDTGLYVLRLHGGLPDPTRPEFSLGASGYWVENGRIRHPVDGITVAGNLRQLLASMSVLGQHSPYRPKVSIGAMLVPELMVAGT